MPAAKFINEWGATLQNAIDDSQTTLVVETAKAALLYPHPKHGYFLTLSAEGIGSEDVFCSAKSGGTLTIIRAQGGTSPYAFPAGTKIQLRLRAGILTSELSGHTESVDLLIAGLDSTSLVPGDGGLVTWIDLEANCTIVLANTGYDAGEYTRIWRHTLLLKQDAVGSRVVTWDSNIKWPGGTAPTVTATADAVDIFEFFRPPWEGAWIGLIKGQNVPF